MSEPRKVNGSWSLLAVLLWQVFLLAGLFPEPVYYALREFGRVATQRAWVNSSGVITVSFAAYVGLFVYLRCREAGIASPAAQARAAQVAVTALFAFIPVSIEFLLSVYRIPERSLQVAAYGICGVKFLSWLYVSSVILRYYGPERERVFAGLLSLFPSAQTDPPGDQEERSGTRQDDSDKTSDGPPGNGERSPRKPV